MESEPSHSSLQELRGGRRDAAGGAEGPGGVEATVPGPRGGPPACSPAVRPLQHSGCRRSSVAALRCCRGRVQPGPGTPPSNPSPTYAPRSPAVGLTVQFTHWEGMCQLFICARLCRRLETRRGVGPWGLLPTTILLWADRPVHHHAESLEERERVAGRLPGNDGL